MTCNLEDTGIRDRFVSYLKSRDAVHAVQAARTLLEESSGTREWSFVRSELSKVPQDELGIRPLRIAILSSFSTEFLHPPLVTYGFVNNLRIDIYQAGFAQFRQEILDPRSRLYAFAPDVVIFAVEGKDWIPELYSDYLTHLETGPDAAISQLQGEIENLTKTLRSQTDATLLIHNFAVPMYSQLGILDMRIGEGQSASLHRLNGWLAGHCRNIAGTYVVDYAGLVARFGALRWYDERMSHLAQLPISMEMLHYLVLEYMKFLRGLTGQTKKCLVLDLDNTLWGGVLGEAGVHGIKLGTTYPGSAFLAFQHAILQLQKRGVLLAAASKNNAADVDEVFASHPHMVLKKEHFACLQINWRPKSESLLEIARHLNIGLEHMVFVDDNPAECQQVSGALPMVRTICLPERAEKFSHILQEEGLFDGLTYSVEDRRRTDLYVQRQQAETLRGETASLEDFYRNLQMQVTLSPLQPPGLPRAAQLTQKTNQFNATTRRFTETEMTDRMNDPNWLSITVSVTDRFGDSGVVGLMMAHVGDEALDIDTFLMSCRVIGRTIESAMLAHLCELASRKGLQQVRGHILPTPKNQPVRDLFERHGFRRINENGNGESSWLLTLSEGLVRFPEWMTVVRNGQS